MKQKLHKGVNLNISMSQKWYSFNILVKTFIYVLPFLLTGIQFVVIADMSSNFASPYNSFVIILIVSMVCQLPNIAIYRRLLSFDVQIGVYVPISLLSIIGPIFNLLILMLVKQELIDIQNVFFQIMIFVINASLLLSFLALIYINRKKLFSIQKIYVISIIVALVSQFALFALRALDMSDDFMLKNSTSFTNQQLLILIGCILGYAIVTISIDLLIKIGTRNIMIFNKSTRYEYWWMFIIPIGLMLLGIFNIVNKKSASVNQFSFFSFNNLVLILAIVSSGFVLTFAIVLLILVKKDTTKESTIKFMITFATMFELIMASITYFIAGDKYEIGWTLILKSANLFIFHLVASGSTKLSNKTHDSSFVSEMMYLLSVLMIFIIIVFNTTRYDIIISSKLFSVELMFIFVEMIFMLVLKYYNLIAKMRNS